MKSTSLGTSSDLAQARSRVGLGLVAVVAAIAVFGAHAVSRKAPAAAATPVVTAAASAEGVDATEFYRQHYGAVTPAESVAAYER